MPDPIISDQTQDSTSPTFPEIPEMTDIPSVLAVPQDTGTTAQASEPMDIPPIIVGSSPPKRKSGKIIATILGILLLVGAVGAGVVLVGQKQLFQQKAAGQCPVINGCVADHPKSRCNDQGQMCTFYIGEPGYESDQSHCTTPGTLCTGSSDHYCMQSGTCFACIQYTECFYKDPDNCVPDESCGGSPPTSTPTPAPTPTPIPGRQSMCKSASISSSNPAQGENITISSSIKNGMTADNFSYPVYNLDNLYGPGNPKPVCVTTGGDFSGNTSACPAGTHQLTFLDPKTTIRQSGSRTVPYASLFVTDANNGNKPLVHTQINAYFQLGSNPVSLPEPDCVVFVNAAFAPTPTPTPPAVACTAVKAYDTNWNLLTGAQLSALSAGDIVRFTISGTPTVDIDNAKFFINDTEYAAAGKGTGTHASEFYVDYTVPVGTTSFTITAKLHSISLGIWF